MFPLVINKHHVQQLELLLSRHLTQYQLCNITYIIVSLYYDHYCRFIAIISCIYYHCDSTPLFFVQLFYPLNCPESLNTDTYHCLLYKHPNMRAHTRTHTETHTHVCVHAYSCNVLATLRLLKYHHFIIVTALHYCLYFCPLCLCYLSLYVTHFIFIFVMLFHQLKNKYIV